MTVSSEMLALLQTHDGYSGTSEGPRIDRLERLSGSVHRPGACTERRPGTDQDADGLDQPVRPAFHQGANMAFPARRERRPASKASATSWPAAEPMPNPLVGKRVAFTVDPAGSGTWAEYAVTSAAGLHPGFADDMRDEDAAGHVVNPMTAMAMFDIVRKRRTRPVSS